MFCAGLEAGETLMVVATVKPPTTTEDGDVLMELNFEAAAGYVPTGKATRTAGGTSREYEKVPGSKLEEMYEAEYGEAYGKWWGGDAPR